MKKIVFTSALLIAGFAVITAFRSEPAQTTSVAPPSNNAVVKWVVDKSHSNVKFTVTHMVVSEVEGSFKNFEGTVEHSAPDFSDAKVNFTVDVTSIDTDNERRDGHLKSDDFFNGEKYPQMKFVSTSMQSTGGKNYKLNGNLTIRDITKPVSFDVTFGGTVTNGGKTKAGFKAKTTINRFDYNLKWDRATEAGSLVVEKEVAVQLNLELDRVP